MNLWSCKAVTVGDLGEGEANSLNLTTWMMERSIPDAYPFSHLIVLLRQKKGSSAFSLAILHTLDLSHRRSLSGIACARQGRSNFIGEIK
ncbi:hypothetical protein V6N13_084703 [Hibiscus sabdariffa]|uniref:Uncharacterized protein n=1 Tax=Hibiscus sabdariffa TaxID=183260 RepID=A0ABR2T210_9ROSI